MSVSLVWFEFPYYAMVISYNNAEYYIDGAKPDDDQYKAFSKKGRAVEDSDYFLACRKMNFFNPSKLTGGFDDISWMHSFFEEITQPTETDIRRALLMVKTVNTGDGAMHKYALKAGGGTASDSIYSSSFSVVVSHPKTGEDTWVVLMKKYSRDFKDVLITYREIADLFEQCASKDQKTTRDAEYARDSVGFILGCVLSGTIKYSGRNPVKASDTDILAIVEKIKPQATMAQWINAFTFFKDRITESQKSRFEEKPGRDVNAEHQLDCLKRLAALSKVKDMFTGRFVLPVPAEVKQLAMF